MTPTLSSGSSQKADLLAASPACLAHGRSRISARGAGQGAGQSLFKQIGDYGLVDISRDGGPQGHAQRRPKAGIDFGMGEGGGPHNDFTSRVPLALFGFLAPLFELVCQDDEREKSDP